MQPFKALHTVAGVAVLSGFVLQNLSPGRSGQWGAPGCHFLPGPSGSMGCLGSLIRIGSLGTATFSGVPPTPLTSFSLHRCSPCQWPTGRAGPPHWLAPSLEAQVGPYCLGAARLHEKMSMYRGWAGAESCGMQHWVGLPAGSQHWRRRCWGSAPRPSHWSGGLGPEVHV